MRLRPSNSTLTRSRGPPTLQLWNYCTYLTHTPLEVDIGRDTLRHNNYLLPLIKDIFIKVAWPNGKALDYESRDSRFDPWRDHPFAGVLLGVTIFSWLVYREFFSISATGDVEGWFAEPARSTWHKIFPNSEAPQPRSEDYPIEVSCNTPTGFEVFQSRVRLTMLSLIAVLLIGQI